MAMSPIWDRSPVWDTVQIAKVAGATSFKFFTTPQGSPDPVSAVNKTLVQTSLTTAQKLGDPESFDVESVQLIFLFGSAEADTDLIINQSVLTFYTNNGLTRSWQGPSLIVPAGVGRVYSTTNAAQNGIPSQLSVLKMEAVVDGNPNPQPIKIGKNENFYWELTFPVSPAPTLTAAVNVKLVLGGRHWYIDRAQAAPVAVAARGA